MNHPKDMNSEIFDELSTEYSHIVKKNVSIIDGKSDYLCRYKVEIASELAPDSQNILDYGCGIGLSLTHLQKLFPDSNIQGYDPSPKSINIASEQHPNIHVTSNEKELIESSYDLIFLSCVIHHIPRHILKPEMTRLIKLLKPKGTILVFEHNPLNPITQVIVATSPIDRDAQLIRKSSLIKILLELCPDFSINGEYSVFFPDFLKFFRPLERTLFKKLPLGAQYFVKATLK